MQHYNETSLSESVDVNVTTFFDHNCVIHQTIFIEDLKDINIWKNNIKAYTQYEAKNCLFKVSSIFEERLIRGVHFINRWNILSFPYDSKYINPGRGHITGYIITIKYYTDCISMREEVLHILLSLFMYRMSKPSVWFLVVVHSDHFATDIAADCINNVFVDNNLLNVLVAVLDQSNTVTNIYSFNPYKLPTGKCGFHYKSVVIKNCRYEDGEVVMRNENVLPEQTPNMEGCSAVLRGITQEPLMILQEEKAIDGNLLISNKSPTFTIFKYILEKFKISEFSTEQYDVGDFEGLVIQFYPNIYDWNDEYFNRYYSMIYYWFLPKSEAYSRWSSMLRIFTIPTWICMIIFLAFSAVVSRYVSGQSGDIFLWIMKLLSLHLGLGIRITKSLHFKCFFTFWLMYCIAISTIFQSFFTSYLVDPGHQHQVDSLEELVEQEYDLVFSTRDVSFIDYHTYTTPNIKYISGGENSLLYLHNNTKTAVFTPEESVIYFYNTVCNGNVSNKLHKIKAFQKPYHLFVEFRNHHLETQFYRYLQRIMESGLPEKLVNDILYPKGKARISKVMSDVVGNYFSFSFKHMMSTFILYLSGMGLGLFVFVLELILYYV
ncbi:hypothetical protein L9F63_007815 [Diploptera punctata]|uniref:Uncharacterized protein n=1 Tax=Diploptera punctata TaxID=6984 RepID=A0AAD7Z6E5_DIPPU|nr:hypothetical protein L9F63_007815 [Diploptera punctata]